MCTIRPLSAIRYAADAPDHDIATRLAPPYDVLDLPAKQALLASDPKNFVKIDLPHVPPKSAGPPEAYQASRRTLQQWLADGTLRQDPHPMLYVYYQTYRYAGVYHVRKMFFARLRLEPFGTGSVFPHERTFGGPQEDRLCLMKATAAQLSPIFGLYEDAPNDVAKRLAQALPPEPLARGTFDGVENQLWGISAPEAIAAVADLMKPKPIYIADGHHRYGTAGLYRDWLVARQGELPEDHPANFVLCVFCAMEDPGLLILPTHRLLPGLSVTADTCRADQRLEVRPLTTSDPDQVVQALASFGPQAVGLHNPAAGGYSAVRPRAADILDSLEPDRSPAWRRLGVAFLHAYLLERVVAAHLGGGKAPTIQYVKSARDAVAAAAQTGGTAVLMQPTTMEEMRGVCGAGDLMPQKSTYFYPKLASGLVVNPLTT